MLLAIIGCGAVANRYYIPAMKLFPELKNQIVFIDNDLSKAKRLAELIGNDNFSDNIEYAIQHGIKGAIVSVPHQIHYKIAKYLINSQVHVLCEKPLSEEPAEVEELLKLSISKNVTLAVNQLRRVFPSFNKISEMIQNNEFGEIRKIKIQEGSIFDWPCETGFYVDPNLTNKGVLLDIGSHILDLICWWLKGKPDVIEYRDDSFGGPESVALLKAKYENCDIEIFISRLADLNSRYQIIGSKLSAECSLYKWDKLILKSGRFSNKVIKMKSGVTLYSDFALPVIENFLGIIQRSEKPIISGESVLNSIRMISECYKNRNSLKMAHYHRMEELN